jgi:hypothetical protein
MVIKMVISRALHISVQTRYHMPYGNILSVFFFSDFSSVQVEADVPLSEAWELWNDRENVTRWMPWIASVKVVCLLIPIVFCLKGFWKPNHASDQ